MKRLLRAFLCLPIASLPLLSGCWDRLDPENMAFIMAVGVDPGPSNDFIYTFAVAMPKSSNAAAGGDTSGGSDKIVDVFSQEASNLTAALMTSQSYVARRLTLIHSKVFVLGESLARKGIMPVMGEVVRNDEFRRTVNVITTKGRADTFIHSIKPRMEKDINLWFELELDPHNIGAVTPHHSRFHDFIVDMEQPGTGATTILSAARSDIEKGKARIPDGSSENRDTAQPMTEDEYAGEPHRSGETPIDFFGSAVYRGQRMAGFLTAYETVMLNMLRGEFEKTTLEFRDPSEKKLTMSIIMSAQKKPDIRIERRGDEVQVFFKVRMEGDLIGSFSELDYTLPRNQVMLEASVEEQLRERASKMLDKTMHQWSTDCFHIGNRVRRTFPR